MAESGLPVSISKYRFTSIQPHPLIFLLSVAAARGNGRAEQLQQERYVLQSWTYFLSGILQKKFAKLYTRSSGALNRQEQNPNILRAGIHNKTDFFSRTVKSGGRDGGKDTISILSKRRKTKQETMQRLKSSLDSEYTVDSYCYTVIIWSNNF